MGPLILGFWMRQLLPALFLLAIACGTADSGGSARIGADGALLPDTQTVDGVLVMRHGADALERARVWTLDRVPTVVIDGGEEFDLTYVHSVTPLSDGRFVTFGSTYGAKLALFDRDGRPLKYLARNGQGPGELMTGSIPAVVGSDTLVVVDEPNGTTNWYHSDAGLLRSERTPHAVSNCFGKIGQLSGLRLVAMGRCLAFQMPEDGTTRPLVPVVVADLDYGRMDTVAMVPGFEMVEIETRRRGVSRMSTTVLALGRHPSVASVDSVLLVATGEHGYVIDLRREDGLVVGRLEIRQPRRPVTDAIRERVIALELARIDASGGERRVDPDEDRRLARETPFPDSLPPYGSVLAGTSGLFWVQDYRAPGDSTWTATAFRLDGAVLGRLTGPRNPDEPSSGPIWFGDDRVIVREVDGDGVVRFGVYGIVVGK